MEEQNGEPYKSIERFLIGNAQEISELKIELLKLHFEEIVKLQKGFNPLHFAQNITERKNEINKLIEVFENFKKNDGGLYDYDADIFDNNYTEIEEIRTKHLLFSIVRSLYLILRNSKVRGELETLRNDLEKFKFNYQYNGYGYIDNIIKLYKRLYMNELSQPKEEKKGLFKRIFGSTETIEEKINKIEESIKKQKAELSKIKEGDIVYINDVITAVETKLEELREVKEKIDKLNVKLNAKDIVLDVKNEKIKERDDFKDKIRMREEEKTKELNALNALDEGEAKNIAQQRYNYIETNANDFIAFLKDKIRALEKEINELDNKKNPNNNKKKLIKEAKEEKDNAEEEFKELEETLNTEISGIQAEIDKLKNNKGSTGGGKRIKYKSTSDEVVILYKNRESKKTVYIKEKTATKYCKINNKYILLSKLNVIG